MKCGVRMVKGKRPSFYHLITENCPVGQFLCETVVEEFSVTVHFK
jgi:hypothetical protein